MKRVLLGVEEQRGVRGKDEDEEEEEEKSVIRLKSHRQFIVVTTARLVVKLHFGRSFRFI